MTDIAIRIGALQHCPDTLRDALTGLLPRISRISRNQKENSPNSPNLRQSCQENSLNSRQAPASPDDLWALRLASTVSIP